MGATSSGVFPQIDRWRTIPHGIQIMRIADIIGVQLRPPERGERAVRSVIGIVLGLLLLAGAPVRESAAQAPSPAPSAPLPAPAAPSPAPVAPLPAPSAPPPAAQAAVTSAPVFKMEEIDQLMAPIALYPDDLLVQILTAATYPLEIVMAARWVADPKNAALKGDALEQALQAQSWDPSVKSLVPFPDVLKMMSDKLEWTQKLGDAFLAQQQDCFASIQRLRQRAQSAGKLTSTKQQTVSTQGPAIVIAPADPDVVYVPSLLLSAACGLWPRHRLGDRPRLWRRGRDHQRAVGLGQPELGRWLGQRQRQSVQPDQREPNRDFRQYLAAQCRPPARCRLPGHGDAPAFWSAARRRRGATRLSRLPNRRRRSSGRAARWRCDREPARRRRDRKSARRRRDCKPA